MNANQLLKLLLDRTHAWYPYVGAAGLFGRALWDVSQGDASGAIACGSVALGTLGIGHGLFAPKGDGGGGTPATLPPLAPLPATETPKPAAPPAPPTPPAAPLRAYAPPRWGLRIYEPSPN